ncbi:hypothetical protein [Pedobacter sp. CFBP9032]|uniref:hypothetical protein n=1 Tax=Pedobacter sp. CFBP9032 TaxID=3096539 RepID=UPI002A6A3AEF|nr:hypothetical protein [Pedobacter sp. CFBP9032]MDY0906604.1 hypothetical protein [Pedobacter sp. CFBP9032]
MGKVTCISLQEFSDSNERETYRGSDRETILEFGNALLQSQMKIESLQLENEKLKEQTLLIEEITSLKSMLKPINKALTSKISNVKKKETKEDVIATFRANQLLK